MADSNIERVGAAVPHAELYWVAVLWFVSLPLGSIANRITYGTWGDCL
jgi:hypothetical protein